MKIKSIECNCCEYILPYTITNEYKNKIIGVFGDSFADLASSSNHTEKHLNQEFSHESSWLFYLGMLSNSEVQTWGVVGGSEFDILQTLINNKTQYDYYIIFHTQPMRKNRTTDKATNLYKTFAAIESITRKEKNVLHLFWNKNHEIYTFSKSKYYIDNILKRHPNQSEKKYFKKEKTNENDQLAGTCHLSNRGNLLLAIKLNKILFSNDESN
tara:strand:- start:429 stop:1067 length:639 start_codon:yes stop_codon:yes gene_type:complete